jgi:hypothetical protein
VGQISASNSALMKMPDRRARRLVTGIMRFYCSRTIAARELMRLQDCSSATYT